MGSQSVKPNDLLVLMSPLHRDLLSSLNQRDHLPVRCVNVCESNKDDRVGTNIINILQRSLLSPAARHSGPGNEPNLPPFITLHVDLHLQHVQYISHVCGKDLIEPTTSSLPSLHAGPTPTTFTLVTSRVPNTI